MDAVSWACMSIVIFSFTRWIFPRLFHSRVPRYEEIAKRGYTVTSREVSEVRDEQDFLQLLETAIARAD